MVEFQGFFVFSLSATRQCCYTTWRSLGVQSSAVGVWSVSCTNSDVYPPDSLCTYIVHTMSNVCSEMVKCTLVLSWKLKQSWKFFDMTYTFSTLAGTFCFQLGADINWNISQELVLSSWTSDIYVSFCSLSMEFTCTHLGYIGVFYLGGSCHISPALHSDVQLLTADCHEWVPRWQRPSCAGLTLTGTHHHSPHLKVGEMSPYWVKSHKTATAVISKQPELMRKDLCSVTCTALSWWHYYSPAVPLLKESPCGKPPFIPDHYFWVQCISIYSFQERLPIDKALSE